VESSFERMKELSEGEVRNLLNDLLKLALPYTVHGDGEQRALADSLVQLCNTQADQALTRRSEAEQRKRTVHLVFSMSDAGSLKVALSNLGKREENEVFAFNDCFSVGPIHDLDNVEGQRYREWWLSERLSNYTFSHLINREHQIGKMIEKIVSIAEQKSIMIWCANNAHDQVGLRFVMHMLKGKRNAIHIMNVSEHGSHDEVCSELDTPFYAQAILEREVYLNIVKKYENVEPISDRERQRYESEWLELAQEKHTLRLWENGIIRHAAEEELDKQLMVILAKLAPDTEDGFVKAGVVIGDMQDHYFQIIDFRFVEYRLWTLISDGYLAFRGLPGAMHQYAVRINTRRINE